MKILFTGKQSSKLSLLKATRIQRNKEKGYTFNNISLLETETL